MRASDSGPRGTAKPTCPPPLAGTIGAPHTELDALYWGPDWTPRPTEQFLAAVDAASSGVRWVIDGNYAAARDLLWPRATHIVWLAYSRGRVFAQVLRPTLWRGITRAPLWSGNRESLRTALFSRESILLWSLTTFDKNRRRYTDLCANGKLPQLQWVALHDPRQARAWLAQQAPLARR